MGCGGSGFQLFICCLSKKKNTVMAAKGGTETEDQQRLRFMVELEFVQCLANPNYLNFLAQRGYFKDQAFINYLKYLLYWKEPDYARYLKYPMCLYFLDLLQYEHFRREVVNAQCTKFIDDQQILLWQHYTRRRTRLLQSQIGTQNSVGIGGLNIGGVMVGQQPIPTGGSTPIQSGQGGQTPNQTMTRKT